MKKEILLELKGVKKYFVKNNGLGKKNKQFIKAVDGVDLEIYKGETLGIVGESGCGKSTLGKMLVKLHEITEGQILYENNDISVLKNKELKSYRKEVQMIFQDPYSSINPRMSIGETLAEPLRVHDIVESSERTGRVQELLETVGLRKSHMYKYPHEFSGGQRQRVGIARALAVKPEFLVLDEPISALDVSIQAQVTNTLEDIQNNMNLTYLFISHDLAMVQYISDRVGVMYLGKLVEIADKIELYKNPKHPYTQALLSAIPVVDRSKEKQEKIILKGDIPSPMDLPTGCRFRTRCQYEMEVCSQKEPELVEISKGHKVACHLKSTSRM